VKDTLKNLAKKSIVLAASLIGGLVLAIIGSLVLAEFFQIISLLSPVILGGIGSLATYKLIERTQPSPPTLDDVKHFFRNSALLVSAFVAASVTVLASGIVPYFMTLAFPLVVGFVAFALTYALIDPQAIGSRTTFAYAMIGLVVTTGVFAIVSPVDSFEDPDAPWTDEPSFQPEGVESCSLYDGEEQGLEVNVRVNENGGYNSFIIADADTNNAGYSENYGPRVTGTMSLCVPDAESNGYEAGRIYGVNNGELEEVANWEYDDEDGLTVELDS